MDDLFVNLNLEKKIFYYKEANKRLSSENFIGFDIPISHEDRDLFKETVTKETIQYLDAVDLCTDFTNLMASPEIKETNIEKYLDLMRFVKERLFYYERQLVNR